jgi:hypothetical protein
LVDDIKAYDGSYVQVLADLSALSQKTTETQDDCDVHSLVIQVHKILGPAGKAIVMKNYFMNSQVITDDLSRIQTCSRDFFSCGKDAGEVFRLLTGYSLDAERLEIVNAHDLIDLVQGFMSSVQWAVTEHCDEMAKNFVDLKTLKKDVERTVEGPVTEYVKTLQMVLGVWGKDPDVIDCAMEYGGMALYVLPTILSSKNVWNLAWESEADNLKRILNQLTVNCHKDYAACGKLAGQLFNTVAPYADDL